MYRLSLTIDFPTDDKEAVRRAVQAYSDIEEAVGKANGDTQYVDVEWYGFDPEEIEGSTSDGWTWTDEEIVQMVDVGKAVILTEDGHRLDRPTLWRLVEEETNDDEQTDRIVAEMVRRDEQAID